jgi:RNA polymerase sigma factor (sigma-70 family)
MSWLYEHRYSLDGLRPLVEIAHWAVLSHVQPEDQDDVEQEIVISLIETIKKYGNKNKSYLTIVAKHQMYKYIRENYKKREKLRYIFETDRGEMVREIWELLNDGDARIDAIAVLATLPKRLIEIGYKRLDGEKLTDQESDYCTKQLAKLRPKLKIRRYANRLSDQERKRILDLHSKGMSMSKIARTMGRTNKAVMRVLAGRQTLSFQDWLDKMKMAAREDDEQIRQAFVNGNNISQIAREFKCGRKKVHRALDSHPNLK